MNIFLLLFLLVADVKHVLSVEPLSTRSIEDFLFEKITEINLKMQRALERLDKIEKDKEREKSELTKVQNPGRPVWLVDELEQDGWEMVFRASSSNGQNVYDAWTRGVGTTTYKPKSLARSYSVHYRNRIVSNWANIGIKYVKYAYYENNREVAYVKFKGAGSDIKSWFDKRRVIASSYSDLTKSSRFNIFSIAGDYRPRQGERRFLINSYYNGCANDYGHMVISEEEPPNNLCNWDNHPKYPQFLYSKINSVDYWERRMFGRADYMAIFIKKE